MEQNSFLFQALVFLAAAVLFVPIAKRLGLGSVLGYLLAGIIIGPFVLGFIGEEGTDIMHYAEFGVVMMLFLIGLELEPPLLWKLRRSIIGLGSLQVILTAIVISAVAMATGLIWQHAVAVGLILALSSTAMVMQLLQEKEKVHIDEINLKSGLNSSAVAAAILNLELQNIVSGLPGKMYKLL